MGNTFHQAAIAEENVGVVVDYIVAILVEACSQCFFSNRHTDGVGDTLPQRTGCRLNTRRITVFRVPGGF